MTPMEWLLLFLRILLAAALYLFMGAVLLLLWRDLSRPALETVAAPRALGRLVVIAREPDDDDQNGLDIGATLPLQAVNSLGRSAINTIIIPDAYASAEHAFLIYRNGQWWLEDRGSRNGTTVNDVPVDEPTVVSAGDLIGVGQTQLKLELGDLVQ